MAYPLINGITLNEVLSTQIRKAVPRLLCKLHFIDLELLAEQKNNGGGESTTTLLIERFYRFSCRYRQKMVYLQR